MRSEIIKAGEVLNVAEVDREAVESWDGEEDLLQENAAQPHPTNEVPEPPEAIKRLFEEATPHMVKLRDDPSDASARTNLEQLNLRLREATGTYIAEAGAQLSDRIWEIQIDQFAMAFQQVKDSALKLAENRVHILAGASDVLRERDEARARAGAPAGAPSANV